VPGNNLDLLTTRTSLWTSCVHFGVAADPAREDGTRGKVKVADLITESS
jgi:hypothetical protein